MERKITILSIDDEENIRFALGELFRFQGWEACCAPTVEKGIEQFRLHRPDIVLIDYHMTGINGVEGAILVPQHACCASFPARCPSLCLPSMKARRWPISFCRPAPAILP